MTCGEHEATVAQHPDLPWPHDRGAPHDVLPGAEQDRVAAAKPRKVEEGTSVSRAVTRDRDGVSIAKVELRPIRKGTCEYDVELEARDLEPRLGGRRRGAGERQPREEQCERATE